MAQQFAKVAADLDHHPKIREAGRNGREVFAFVLRVNANQGRAGWVSARHVRPRYLSDVLMMPESDAVDGLERAVTAELLRVDGDQVHIVGWDDEWARGPIDGATRTAQWREKTTARMPRVTTSDVANVTVTKCDDENVTQSHRDAGDASEKSREEEKRVEENTQRARKRAPRARSAATVLPDGWEPDATHVALAARLGIDCAREAERFRDRARAKAATYADWGAAFRNWLNSPYQQPARASPRSGGSNPSAVAMSELRRLEAEARARGEVVDEVVF